MLFSLIFNVLAHFFFLWKTKVGPFKENPARFLNALHSC